MIFKCITVWCYIFLMFFIRKAVDIFPERVFVCVVVSWSKYVKKCLILKAKCVS